MSFSSTIYGAPYRGQHLISTASNFLHRMRHRAGDIILWADRTREVLRWVGSWTYLPQWARGGANDAALYADGVYFMASGIRREIIELCRMMEAWTLLHDGPLE